MAYWARDFFNLNGYDEDFEAVGAQDIDIMKRIARVQMERWGQSWVQRIKDPSSVGTAIPNADVHKYAIGKMKMLYTKDGGKSTFGQMSTRNGNLMDQKLLRHELIRNLDDSWGFKKIGMRTFPPQFIECVPKHVLKFPWQQPQTQNQGLAPPPVGSIGCATDPPTGPSSSSYWPPAGCAAGARPKAPPGLPLPSLLSCRILIVSLGLKIPLPGHKEPLLKLYAPTDGPTVIESIKFLDASAVEHFQTNLLVTWDCRHFHCGRDCTSRSAIVSSIVDDKRFPDFLVKVKATLKQPGLETIVFFCDKGRQRSVACATIAGWVYEDAGVVVSHMHMARETWHRSNSAAAATSEPASEAKELDALKRKVMQMCDRVWL